MQPCYALLPATSYPKTIEGMCYAEIGAHINPLVNNQSGAGRQSSMGCRHAYPGMRCPIIDLRKLDMLSQNAKCNQAIPACSQLIRSQGS